MKKLRLLLIIVCFISFSDNFLAQLQNVTWKNTTSPALTGEAVFSEKAALDYLTNGNWYFSFFDENAGALVIRRYDMLSQTWTTIFNQSIVNGNVLDVETYESNGELYVAVLTDVTSTNFNLWKMDDTEIVNQVFGGEQSSANGNRIDFVIANDQLFLASNNMNSDLTVDVYDLTNQTVISSDNMVGFQNYSAPGIVLDQSDNSIVVSGADLSDKYFIYKSPIQATPNFTGLNSTGEISGSTFFTGSANGGTNGGFVRLIEKKNTSPEVIFLHEEGGNPNFYRFGLYNNSATDTMFSNPDLLAGAAVAQFGNSTFVGGLNNISSVSEVWEVRPDGTKMAVADNTNPTLETNTTDGLIISFSPSGSGRVASFYHLGTGNGTSNGILKMTNNAPSITSGYDVNKACLGSTSYAIENISFQDLDGDQVEIIPNSFTSTNAAIVDPQLMTAFEFSQNVWSIEVNSQNITVSGSATITFDYTDGLDTLSESVVIETVAPASVSFNTSSIETCINENAVDLSEYVDSTGGSFLTGDFNSDDGIVPLDSLIISTLPETKSVLYDYVDVNGCLISATSTLTIYENPSTSLNVTNTSCGANDGEIIATVNSPNGAYSNYWNTGDQDVLSVGGLSPGTYYHNVVDEKGCVAVAQADLQASDVTVSGTVTNPTCFGASDGGIELSINGANGPYDVLWSSGHSSPTIQNLSAGNYVVTVSNDDGCTVSESFNLTQPDKIVMEYFKNEPSCSQSNGSIQQTMIQGGSGNYSYSWTSGNTSQDMTGVPAGTYGLEVTDDQGCVATRSFQLNPVEGAGVGADVTKAVCGTNSGSIELDVYPNFGESVTSITWSNGETTEDIYNLAPGVYTCQIEQTNGCTADYSWQVKARKPPRPDICVVTVDTTTTTNLIVWEKPAVNIFDIHHYNIYRETNVAGQFQLIDTVNYSSISVFNDVVASPMTRSWRYRISAVTSCGNESARSTAHKTIHMVINDLGNGEYKVVWDNYEGFPYSTYDLLRYTDQDGDWVTVDAGIPFNALPNTVDTPPSTQGLNYMIEVTPPGGICSATEGKAQDYNSSRSNKPRSIFNPGDGTGDPNNSLVKHENEDYTIAVYPNPSDGNFEVALYHENSNIEMEIQVINLQGKVVYNSSVKNGVNYVDLSNVESGVYFVNVQDGNNSDRMKIVVK